MVSQVQQTLDVLFWALHRILYDEGITPLHWAILQRAYLKTGGVRFREVMKATGQPKDNVRRAAKFLQESKLGKVIADPDDHRARIFVLKKRGRDRTQYLEENLRADLLVLLGANLAWSKRVKQFTQCLLNASGFLPPGDLATRR
jgi:DNA-binding MarR family transcriptional regulator